ncbi:MAG: thioredoxin family protein, partial [Acidimicrobiales bacterium]
VSGFWIFSLKGRDGAPAPAPLRAFGLIAVVYGVLLLIGAASGSHDPLQPLNNLRAGGGSAVKHEGVTFERIKTVQDLESAVAAASAAGKPVLLDFYADWCVSCKEMEAFTFSDPKVQAALAGMTLLQVDVTANSPADRELLKRFRLFGPPGIIFFDASGREIPGLRVIGFQGADRFLETLALAQKF